MKSESASSNEHMIDLRLKVNTDIFNALKILDKKINRNNSDVVRTALYDYITKNYPGLIPKTDFELEMKAKDYVRLREYERKYSDKLQSKPWISEYDKEVKESASQADTAQRKINTINKKLTQTGISPKDKQKLIEEKEKQLQKYDYHLRDLDQSLSNLQRVIKKSNYNKS